MWRGGEVESVEKKWEKFRDIVMECTNDVCGMRHVGGQRSKSGMKKWAGRGPEGAELLRDGFREEIGLLMTDTGYKEWLRNVQSKLQNELRTGDGESNWGMISRVIKICFLKT